MADNTVKSLTSEPEFGKALGDKELTDFFWDCLKDSKSWFDPIWKKAERLFDAYAGETLSDADKGNLQRTKRPPIDYNLMLGTVNAVVGGDQADRKEAVFRGTGLEAEDAVQAEWGTRLNRAAMAKSDGYRHESDGFTDDLVCGYGFTETFLDLSKRPAQVRTVHVQPWECFPDPDATDDCLVDGRFFIRCRGWILEEIQARWPDKANDVGTKVNLGLIPTSAPVASERGKWSKIKNPGRRSRVLVYDFCYKRYVPHVVWTDPETGEEMDTDLAALAARRAELEDSFRVSSAEFQQQAAAAALAVVDAPPGTPPPPHEMLPQPPEPLEIEVSFRYPREKVFRAFILGDSAKPGDGVVLEHNELEISGFPYEAITCFRHKNVTEERVRFFGVAEVVLGAQMYLNRTLGVQIDILGRNSKGGGFIEKGAVLGSLEAFQAEQSIPGMWHVVANDAVTAGRIKEKPVGQGMQGFERFLDVLISMFSYITGVTDALKGTMQTERSNVLISNMQSQSMVMLNPAIDPFTLYRIRAGRLRLEMMLKLLPVSTLDKMIGTVNPRDFKGMLWDEETDQPILDERGMPLTPGAILKMVDPLEFNVAVDVGQASPTSRQAVYKILEQGVFKELAETIKGAGLDISPLLMVLLKNMPLPGDQAKILGDTYEGAAKQLEAMKTGEGVMNALLGMPPDQAAEIVGQVMQQIQAQQGGGQAPPQA